ncbi:uncharacterized protein LOC144110858 [Amblyomma americanum]
MSQFVWLASTYYMASMSPRLPGTQEGIYGRRSQVRGGGIAAVSACGCWDTRIASRVLMGLDATGARTIAGDDTGSEQGKKEDADEEPGLQGASLCTQAIKGTHLRFATTGHGSIDRMRSTNPFVFVVQVSKKYGKCFRSNDLFLLVLPYPRLCCLLQVFPFCLRKLLLLAGDIESNPGPDMTRILQQLNDIAVDRKDMKENRLVNIDNKLDALSGLENRVMSCQEQVSCMSTTIERLEARLEQLENYSRRSNLIIYGIPESEEETNETLEETVNKDIFHDILGLDPIPIERIHRLGKPAIDKTRPVILKLLDSRHKTVILKNGKKLKGKDYSIGEDFSKNVRELRKKLWDSAKPNRDKKERVSLVFDKLYINNIPYVWDYEKNDKVKVQKNDGIGASRPVTRSCTQLRNRSPIK